MTSNSQSGKHVLLTGGAGFIGSHTVEAILKQTNWTVTILDRLTYAGNLNRLHDMKCWEKEQSRVDFVYHDFRSPITGNVYSRLMTHPADYIIHMGAESHVGNSILNPLLFSQSNVDGTVNLLDFAKTKTRSPVRFLYVSTDEVYGGVKNGEPRHSETARYNPSNPYSASKMGGEAFTMAFHNTYGLDTIISNTMNNFGERQEVEKFIPKTLKSILNDEPVTIHCRIENKKVTEISSRCWLHARNHADALIFLLEHGVSGEKYHVVGEQHDVREVATMIGELVGKTPRFHYEDFHTYTPGHDMHYGLDGSKMAAMGWKAPLDFEGSLARTVTWMLNRREWL
jgi:dTDP-glucose 4,6-dehydratase